MYKKWGKFRLTYKIKGYMITVFAAISIGLLFGMVSLQMTKQEETIEKTNVDSFAQTNEEATASGTALGEISFFVVQGGVFLNKENAEKLADDFEKTGYKTFNWIRDDQIFLLTGIADTEAEATIIADKMKKENLDVFVKEWNVEQNDTELSATDYIWLGDMLELWKQSLQTYTSDGTIPKDKWKDLVKDASSSSKVTSSLQKKIEELIGVNENVDWKSLLGVIEAYEGQLEKE